MNAIIQPPKKANKLVSTKLANRLVNEYWDMVFNARAQGKLICWYEGSSINPFLQAADICWVHGEAYAAMLAARHLEEPAQRAAEEAGYMRELCSYARTHLGCAITSQNRHKTDPDSGVINPEFDDGFTARLPAPDMIISAYAYCSTGQQWDEMTSRVFGKKIPIFNVSLPLIWGNKKDSRYLGGQEWDETSAYVARQLYEMVKFIEERTGKPYPWDRLYELMGQVKTASKLRLEAMDLCSARPSPASFFDWIVSIAPINNIPVGPGIVEYFSAILAEVKQRVATGEGAVPKEKYRLYFDGIMNWTRVGWLAEKFARFDATVIAGRYTHMAFWQEPDLIDPTNPVLGMAQNYLICPMNHSAPILVKETLKLCEKYEIDGMIFHASRTCRAFTNPHSIIADAVQKRLGMPTTMFEGDLVDDSFYKDELVNSRVEAMLEQIDQRRASAAA